MRKPSQPEKSGTVLFAVVAMMIFLLPLLLMFARFGSIQNKQSLRDRNIKTGREMAESVQADFMNTFSTDWHRNYFSTLYLPHETTVFSGLGSVTNNYTATSASSTVSLISTAKYNKGVASFPVQISKRIRATYFFSSDIFRFDFVFPGPVVIGGNVSRGLRWITQSTTTFFVDGNLNGAGGGALNPKLKGRWVVRGTLTANNGDNFDGVNSLAHCLNLVSVSPDVPGTVRQFLTVKDFIPDLNIVGPSGSDTVLDLSYYRTHTSSSIVLAGGNSLFLQFNAANVTTDLLDPTLTPIPGNNSTWVYPSAASDPFMLSVEGGDVYLEDSTIQKRITLSVSGGSVHVRGGNVTYPGGATNANSTRSLAVLAEGDIFIDRQAALNQNLVGLYATPTGRIVMDTLFNRVVRISGTVYGFFDVSGAGIPDLRVTADSNLLQFPPPLYPRRPRLIEWRYN